MTGAAAGSQGCRKAGGCAESHRRGPARRPRCPAAPAGLQRGGRGVAGAAAWRSPIRTFIFAVWGGWRRLL